MSKKIEICLLMTLGMSLLKWRENGSLEREIRPYYCLFKYYGIVTRIYDFSANSAWTNQQNLSIDLINSGIKLVPLYGNYEGENRILKYLFALKNFVTDTVKQRYIFIKTNQTKGSHFATLLKIFKKDVFLLHRSGYDYSTFSRRMFGFGPKYMVALIETCFTNIFSDRIHVATKTELDRLPKRFINKAVILPNWAEKCSTNVKKQNHFLFVGRLVEQKNIIRLLLNFPTDRDLIIVGDGPLHSKVCKIIQDRSLSVIVHTKMEYIKLLNLMKQSKALICCSNFEGNPKVVIEAIVNNVPVIVKNSMGLKDLFRGTSLGIKFDDFIELEEILDKIDEFEFDLEVQDYFQKLHSLNHLLDVEVELINNFTNNYI
jgi:glycosyltransferase involved in cell wall biosynthesis